MYFVAIIVALRRRLAMHSVTLMKMSAAR